MQDWYCPNCDSAARTVDTKVPHHPCKKIALGLMVPLVPKGQAAKVEAVERQDFIGTEQVQMDENRRPVMSVVVTRDDGQDCTVFAPVAATNVGRK